MKAPAQTPTPGTSMTCSGWNCEWECYRERGWDRVCVYVCVCERERERERVEPAFRYGSLIRKFFIGDILFFFPLSLSTRYNEWRSRRRSSANGHHDLLSFVLTHTHANLTTYLPVWPDWAIFERIWLQIFLQKYPKYLVIVWAICLENSTFEEITFMASFRATLGKHLATFYSI